MDTVSMLNKMSFYCQPILPLVYDESMSYYETLCKVVGQLNTTGETVNKLNAGLTEEATERENADAALGARLAELEKTFANVHLIAFENPGRIIGTAPTREQLYKWVTSGDVICTLLRTSEPGRENIFAVTCNYDAGSYLSPLSNDFEIVVPIKTSYNENNDTAVSQKLVKLTIPDGELSEPWGYQEFEIKTPATSADGIVNVNARHYNTGTIDVNITPSEFLGMFYTHKAGAQIAVGVNARLTYDGRDYASGSAVVSVGDGTDGKVIIEFNNYYNGVFTENNVDQLKTQHIFLVGAQATNTWAIETIDSRMYDLERDKAFEFTHNVDGTVTTDEDSTPAEVAFYYERNDKLYQNIPVRLIDTKDNAEYWNGVFDRKSDGRISYTFTTSYYRASKMLVRIIELSATPKSGSTFAGDEKWVYAAKEFELPLAIDTAMSDTSTNAVQNKVIKKYVDDHVSADVYVDFWPTGSAEEYNKDIKGYIVELATDQTFDSIFDSIKAGNTTVARLYDSADKSNSPIYSVDTTVSGDKELGTIHFQFVSAGTGSVAGFSFIGETITLLKVSSSTTIFLAANENVLPTPNPDGSDNGKVPTVENNKWELKAPSGGGSADAVLYTAQTLTTEQKKQARDNIDAEIADFVVNGTVNSDRTVTLDKTFAQIQEAVQGVKKDHVRLLLTMFGTTFVLPAVVIGSNEIAFQTSIIGVNDTLQTVNVTVNANGPALKINLGLSLDSDNRLPQHSMAADPTTDMQIATKQYVDAHAGGGSSVTVDTAMSDTSTNAVQNKVIKKYVDDHLSGAPITIKLGTGGAATSTATFDEIKAALEAGKAPILDSAPGTTHWFALNWTLSGSGSLTIQYGTFNVEGGGAANFTIDDVSVSSTGITYSSRQFTSQ